jgi:putative ABC transport system substrate-binding protein
LEDLPAAFGDARREGAQAVIFMGSNLTFGYRKEIAELEIANHLPSIHPSLCPRGRGRQSDVLRPRHGRELSAHGRAGRSRPEGARPAELPVEEPTKFTLAVNMKTANALGITLPQLILAQADELIE